MPDPIPFPDYCSEATFLRERERLFRATWQFAGYTHDLDQPGDWIAVDIAGIPVTVQNCSGTLKAFLNVCSHRSTLMRSEPKGNGRIRCPYHGWCYDEDGLPCAIPSKPRFDGLDAARLRTLALRQSEVEICGRLVFVRLSGEGPSLEDSLGEAGSLIRDLTAACGELLVRHEYRVKANWKFLIEISLEAYHVGHVHPETFAPLNLQYPEFQFFPPHSAYVLRAGEEGRVIWNRFSEAFQSRPFHATGYFHVFAFPGLAVSTTFGSGISVIDTIPLGPDESIFRVDVFKTTLDPNLSPGNRSMVDLFYFQEITGIDRINQEDIRIVELQQKGVVGASPDGGILSEEEVRISRFWDAYHEWVS